MEYLDNTIIQTTHQTEKQLYEEWIDEVRIYTKYNTYRFCKENGRSRGSKLLDTKNLSMSLWQICNAS